MQTRRRTCTNPPPSEGGKDCRRLGLSLSTRVCNTQGCSGTKKALFLISISRYCGGAAMKWLELWTSDLRVDGSRPSPYYCVVSLDKKLYHTNCLPPPRYVNGYRRHTAGGNPTMERWTSIQSRVE